MRKSRLKQRFITIIALLVTGGVIGLLVMASGIVPIKASSGHWKVTKWVLDFSKGRSVATHSLGIDVPPLDVPAMVKKGAGHYESGCVHCHGSPARPASPIALSMTAAPPSLPPKIKHREPAELFYIVKHGIKFTGMPAWPAQQRDDEVWAMVAFLLKLPKLDQERYVSLAFDFADVASMRPPAALSPATLETCTRCHGRDGLGRGKGAFPKLAGQKREYLLQSLQAFAEGRRHSGMMQPVVAVLSEDTQTSLADYFASLPSKETPMTDDVQYGDVDEQSRAIERGRTIAQEGIPARSVASCVDCHGPGDFPTAQTYPHLAGQYANYTVLQLELFQDGRRGGTNSAHLMQPIVKGLTDQDMHDVAAYYASLSPE